jgi:hypothetical protein
MDNPLVKEDASIRKYTEVAGKYYEYLIGRYAHLPYASYCLASN